MDMPDTNAAAGNIPNAGTGHSPSPGSMSSGDAPADAHPSVAGHDHVFHIEDGN